MLTKPEGVRLDRFPPAGVTDPRRPYSASPAQTGLIRRVSAARPASVRAVASRSADGVP